MPKLNPQQAEQLHARYAATLTNPVPIETFIPGGELDEVTRNTYTRGMLHHDEQFIRIRINQLSSMDLAEPYDVGVANAIQLLTYIMTGVLPTFIPKPASTLIAIDQLQSENDKLNAKVKKLKLKLEKSYEEVKTLQAGLEESVATKSLEILALEAKYARELAEVEKAAEPVAVVEPVKSKKKWSLGKSK